MIKNIKKKSFKFFISFKIFSLLTINMNHTDYFLGDENRRNINDYYEITKKELGKGSYGLVHQGILKGSKLKRAIKIIEKAKVSNV